MLFIFLAVIIMLTGCVKEDKSVVKDEYTKSEKTAVQEATAADMKQFSNPLWEGADPYVIVHDGTYYFTHCDGHNKIYVSKSSTLKDKGELKLVYEFPQGKWNSSLVWGPAALFKWDDGKWYMFYCAADGPDMNVNNINHRLGVLRATTDDLTGPYEDLTPDAPLNSGDSWAIAAQPFQDFEGKWYITWSGLEDNSSFFPQNTYIAPMENPWTIGDRVKISTPDQPWEKGIQPIQEGQTVVRRGNKLIMLYSADASWTDNYCLGMLTYSGGDVLNPASWVKHPEPVLYKTSKIRGPGGPAITKSPDGKEDWLFYHAAQWANSGWRRYVCAQKFFWDENDIPVIGDPIPYGELMSMPSGDPGLPRVSSYDCVWSSSQIFEWITFGGDWAVEGGGAGRRYVLKTSPGTAKAVVRTVAYEDFSLQCSVSLTNNSDDSNAGLIFRVTQPYIGKNGYNGYYAAIDAAKGEVRLMRVEGSKAEALAAKPVKVDLYTDHTLKIEARGKEIKVYFDDMENSLLEVKDETYKDGYIGVKAYNQSASWRALSSKALN